MIISGGGTGGHVYPAIAVADRLKEIDPDIEILFVGASGKMEMEKVPQAGYRIEGLNIRGIQRKLTAGNLSFPFRLLDSLAKANRLINEFKPDVVAGFGGYASGPTLYVSARRKIPTVIQEQNSFPGITNKLLAKSADVICVAYPGMERFFPKEKIRLTGNPVRADLMSSGERREEGIQYFGLESDKKTLLLFGGSLGARTLNDSMKAATSLLKKRNDIQVLWQMGKLYAEQYGESETAMLPNVHAVQFIDRMDLAYAVSDVVLCRAGASTISELCLVGASAILVPSPNVAEDHQTKNAMALVERNAALIVKDVEAVSNAISTAIDLLDDEDQRSALREEILRLARPDATAAIASEVLKAGRR